MSETAETAFEDKCREADALLFHELATHHHDPHEMARIISQHVDMKIALHIELLADRVEDALGARP